MSFVRHILHVYSTWDYINKISTNILFSRGQYILKSRLKLQLLFYEKLLSSKMGNIFTMFIEQYIIYTCNIRAKHRFQREEIKKKTTPRNSPINKTFSKD